jgi:hypothetical protein
MKIQGKHIILCISLLILIYINYLCYLTYLEYPTWTKFLNDSVIWLLFIILEGIMLTIFIVALIVTIIQEYWDEEIYINFKLKKDED